MKMRTSLLLLTLAAFAVQPLMAHGGTQPKHGGIVATNGETLFELVNAPAGVQLYVVDDDEPVKAANMTAKLATEVGGKVQNIALRPVAGNRFDGPKLALRPGAKVAVMVIDNTSQAHLGGTFVVK